MPVIGNLNYRVFGKMEYRVFGNKSAELCSLDFRLHDAITGEPIKGVSLSFVLDGNGTKAKASKATEAIVKKTAEKGGFNIKSLPQGMYTVTIKKNGFADQIETIAVSDGELTELNIQLSKN